MVLIVRGFFLFLRVIQHFYDNEVREIVGCVCGQMWELRNANVNYVKKPQKTELRQEMDDNIEIDFGK